MSSVDVVVPCYRYAHFLRQCVESVLSQSGVSVRVLIIDDASPDNTAEVAAALAREDPRVSFIRHSENKGHITTYNEGIDWASADSMLLLSADDYLLPGALSRAAELMDAHPEVGFTFGNVIELSDDGIEMPLHTIIEATDDPDRRILGGRELIELSGADDLVTTCTAVVRTKLQKKLGGYRHDLPHSGDMEMWLRFAAHASAGFIFAYQGVYRRHSASMSTGYYFISDGRQVYKDDGRLGDLKQRQAALDYLGRCKDVLPEYEQLRRNLYRRLSEMTMMHAHAAFNEGRMEESRELSDFALAVCPEINRSPPWMKLTCKRWLGARTWHAVRPVAAAIRRYARAIAIVTELPGVECMKSSTRRDVGAASPAFEQKI